MLSREDNELLCRVGPGTPMGQLLREYWLPVLKSSDVERGGQPLRVKLLSEDLVAFRDTSGRVGLLGEHCSHRATSLALARNEDNGLRCVYHGWMYDVSGRCIDMPNEPEETRFADKVRHPAYACTERNGIIWTYMGSREAPPALPDLEWNMVPEDQVVIWRNLQFTNWVQGLEGNIDSSHLSFLHTRLTADGDGFGGGNRGLWYVDKTPRMEVRATDYGVMYGAGRMEDPDNSYWRVTQFLMPFYGMFAPVSPAEIPLQWWIPLDDHTVMKWDVRLNPNRPITEEERARVGFGDPGGFVEFNRFDPYTQFRLTADQSNGWLLDYEAQEERRFSGVPSVNLQDKAVLETMGPIVKRHIEHLGTSDAMIIQVRKRLINAAKALRDHGTTPPGVGQPESYRVRSATTVLPNGTDWLEAIGDKLVAFTDLPAESAEGQIRAGV